MYDIYKINTLSKNWFTNNLKKKKLLCEKKSKIYIKKKGNCNYSQ